ncbi:MAG: hypothetical protein J6E38_02875 [Clostridia bacterium]|nr:hypothetical protein [Clostridia bacterium]
MPYIEAKLSCKLTPEKAEALKCGFGKAIECIPGKNEGWLMVNIEDEKNLYFKGNKDGETAFISVSIFGKSDADSYSALTGEICSLISKVTGISPDRTYVTYSEYDKWGWNGFNF